MNALQTLMAVISMLRVSTVRDLTLALANLDILEMAELAVVR